MRLRWQGRDAGHGWAWSLLFLAGCYSSYRIETDAEVGDSPPEDVVADASAARCPPALSTGAVERLARRWSVRVPGVWQAGGSAGGASRYGVLLIVPPRPASEAPWVFPLAAATGELLRSAGDAFVADLAGATAVAAIQGSDFPQFVGAAPDGAVVVKLRIDGTVVEAARWPVEWGGVLVNDLRAAGAGEIEDSMGLTAGGSIGREAPRLLAVLFGPLVRTLVLSDLGEELTGDVPASAFVTQRSERTSGPTDFVVTAPIGRLDFWDPPRPRPFDRPAPTAPASGGPLGSRTGQLLVARRGVPPSADDPMVVESWPGESERSEVHRLTELEGLVDRPYPRELAGGDRDPALAWVAHDGGPGLRAACLYVTPLGPDGAPSGASVRVDEAGDMPSGTTPEFVRLHSDDGTLWVVWRCVTDLCVVALDRSS